LFSNKKIKTAYQSKALEYGATLCPLIKLIAFIEKYKQRGISPLLILQADQFGILHAPFANARTYLFENNFNDVPILVHTPEGKMVKTTISQLVPFNCRIAEGLEASRSSSSL